MERKANIPSPPIDVDLPTNLIGDRDHVLVMRFSVFYRRRSGNRKRLRVGRHVMPDVIAECQFRLNLVEEYNRTNKRVLKIEQHEGGLEECMDICDKVEFLKQIKSECVEAIRSREPDAATPDDGIDDATVAWVAGFVDTWFGIRITLVIIGKGKVNDAKSGSSCLRSVSRSLECHSDETWFLGRMLLNGKRKRGGQLLGNLQKLYLIKCCPSCGLLIILLI